MNVLLSYILLGPIKFVIYYFFLKSQLKLSNDGKSIIQIATVRLIIGIVFGFLVLQLPRMLGISAPPEYARLGFNPFLLLIFIPVRPVEWWLLIKLGKHGFHVDPQKRVQFIVKGSIVSLATDFISIILALLGILSVGGIC